MPFQFQAPPDTYGKTIGQLIAERGQQLAAGQAGVGAAWAGGVGQAAQAIATAPAQARAQELQGQQVTLNQMNIDAAKRAMAYQQTATTIASQVKDPASAEQLMMQHGIPASVQEPILKSLTSIDNNRKEAQADAGHIAYQVLKSLPADADADTKAHALSMGLGAAMGMGAVNQPEADAVLKSLASGADPMALAVSAMALSPSKRYEDILKPVVLAGAARPGGSPATLQGPTGPIATGAAAGPAPDTIVSLAVKANPNNPAAALAAAQAKPAPSLEEQYLAAKTAGDEPKAQTVLDAITTTAAAKQDPAAKALADQLKALSVKEAQARLDSLNEKNQPIDITPQVQKTMLGGGLSYLDTSKYQPSELSKVRDAANKAGIPLVSKDIAEGLQSADRASINLDTMWRQIEPYVAKDASGRLVTGPRNTLAKVFQSNPVLGAYGSWRTAAVQAIQSLAEKGMGLRMNQAEIGNMIDALPKPTDDAATAKQKLDDIQTQLEGKVKVALTPDRSTLQSDAKPKPIGRFNPATGKIEFY